MCAVRSSISRTKPGRSRASASKIGARQGAATAP
jgi:hypothetical protein